MFKMDGSIGKVRVPYLLQEYFVNCEGLLSDKNGGTIPLDVFNKETRLDVKSVEVLVAVTFHRFTWPPVYWRHLIVLKMIDSVSSPENYLLGIEAPVESLEYPGYFMIPYFGGYVISPEGRLLKRSFGSEILSSKGSLGYFTYRMTDDSNKTLNRLRHRILCYAFKPYPANVEDLDVNHIDGIPGNDSLDNLEWVTRSSNMNHAYAHGLRNDNIEVEIRDVVTGKVFIFASYSQAGRFLGVTETTISNRAKTNGYKVFAGYQFRNHPSTEAWPENDTEEGSYMVTFPDGKTKTCGCEEAARLAGLTRTSLLRAIREGRCYGKTNIKIQRR